MFKVACKCDSKLVNSLANNSTDVVNLKELVKGALTEQDFIAVVKTNPQTLNCSRVFCEALETFHQHEL